MLTLRTVDLNKINSMTKYPSILTYHALDPKNGALLEPATSFAGKVVATEKIDGTNARMIFLPDGSYLLGSREELLYAKGDLIGNPALGIVAALKEIADRLVLDSQAVTVVYGELYGGKVTGASKYYTSDQTVGFRLFDIARIPNASEIIQQPVQAISAWREAGGQFFVSEQELTAMAESFGLPLTPRIAVYAGDELPSDIQAMHLLLQELLPISQARLDDQAAGKPEGIVFRTEDRSVIAKARLEDYERTARRKK